MVERSLNWSARYKRLTRDYESLAFAGLILAKVTGFNLLPGA